MRRIVLAAADPRDESALALAKVLVARGARLAARTWERTGETTSPLNTLFGAGAARTGSCSSSPPSVPPSLRRTFLREGIPARWEAVRAARYELGCSFDARSDCGDAGWSFHKGEGVAVDLGKAMAAYRKGCDLEGAWACGMVGTLHENGEGVPEDPAEAARWYTRGCDGNDGQSCYRLGALARDGRGAAQDRTRALALFEKACERKYEKGCAGASALR